MFNGFCIVDSCVKRISTIEFEWWGYKKEWTHIEKSARWRILSNPILFCFFKNMTLTLMWTHHQVLEMASQLNQIIDYTNSGFSFIDNIIFCNMAANFCYYSFMQFLKYKWLSGKLNTYILTKMKLRISEISINRFSS